MLGVVCNIFEPRARSGSAWLGRSLALGVSLAALDAVDMTVADVIAALSWKPAAIAGVADTHGRPIRPGEPANLTVFDPDESWEVVCEPTDYVAVRGALEAGAKVGLKMNVPKTRLDEVTIRLPALHTPTISYQLDPEWVAVEIITDEWVVRDLIPVLKQAGATGITVVGSARGEGLVPNKTFFGLSLEEQRDVLLESLRVTTESGIRRPREFP